MTDPGDTRVARDLELALGGAEHSAEPFNSARFGSPGKERASRRIDHVSRGAVAAGRGLRAALVVTGLVTR